MATSKSQKESEQPAKVYQLDAVNAEITNFKREVTQKLDTLIKQTSSVVTEARLEVATKDIKDDITDYVKTEIEKVHLTYGPIKNGAWWLVGIVAAGLIGQIVIQITKPWGG